jgi:hypothetical protein
MAGEYEHSGYKKRGLSNGTLRKNGDFIENYFND